ncbi:uncharacterized protein LOC117538739 [Gymnodraco acuticeps]|uniref:Uncharacterized protein LOC117538739 n=1 Tax=Gymnodraco acuticeps TaxID=8218 RepID=A0A6P8T9Y3_GYMAC|nr:uncharacterized protein LOC117538739 [Gymnodraco acuticeps]
MSSNSSNASSSSEYTCFRCRPSFIFFISYSVANILVLLPLCSSIFYLGVQRYRGRDSTIRGSHSDVFTYHMAVMEMVGVLGSIINCLGAILANPLLLKIVFYFYLFSTNGQMPFHILTCVERHLAVVHPITYLRLRNRGGIMIRNVSIAFAWLLFFTWFPVSILSYSMAPYFCVTTFSMVVVTFCSLSVLRALIRPGPGEGGGDKGRLGQSKKRAFYTIMAIMLALCFRFCGHLLLFSILVSMDLGFCMPCALFVSQVWLCLPSSLVLPLLFLHRAGKLTCGKKTDSGSDQRLDAQ